jgi:hypothetical protein
MSYKGIIAVLIHESLGIEKSPANGQSQHDDWQHSNQDVTDDDAVPQRGFRFVLVVCAAMNQAQNSGDNSETTQPSSWCEIAFKKAPLVVVGLHDVTWWKKFQIILTKIWTLDLLPSFEKLLDNKVEKIQKLNKLPISALNRISMDGQESQSNIWVTSKSSCCAGIILFYFI